MKTNCIQTRIKDNKLMNVECTFSYPGATYPAIKGLGLNNPSVLKNGECIGPEMLFPMNIVVHTPAKLTPTNIKIYCIENIFMYRLL